MTRAQKGDYIDMLACSWDQSEPGTLPLPEEVAAKICGISIRSFRRLLKSFPELWQIDGNRLVNPALRSQWEQLKQLKEKQADAARKTNESYWKRSSVTESVTDRSASAFAPAFASTKEEHTDHHHHLPESRPDDDRVQRLFDAAGRSLIEQGEDPFFVQVALEILDERSLQLAKSPPATVQWYLVSFANLKHESEAMEKIWAEARSRRALREKYMPGFTGVPKNEAVRQEFNRRIARAGKPP